MNNYRDIIKAPIITEKSASLSENGNIVTFSVDPKANKTQIKQAVEKIFNVKVESVNTINVKPKIPKNLCFLFFFFSISFLHIFNKFQLI